MKIPPKKPHFFKPILPGFKEKFKIPKGFLKYLKGHDHIERAILKRTGKKWLVKLNDHRLEDGWKKFAEELNLQLGDLLVFRHEGDMEFEVSIFDSSCCEKQYGTEEKALTPEETSEKYEFKAEKPNTSIKLSGKVSYHTEAATHKRFGCSHFAYTIKPYCLTYGILYVPKHFARANGLITNKKCDLIIKDETRRCWNLRITSGKTQVYIGDGCRKFIADNCLKKGDRIMFEVVTDGETPIWKFRVVTDAETLMRKFHEKPTTSIKSSIKASSHGKTAAHKPFGHSSFVCTIKPYCLTYGFLRVPNDFACANGFIANKNYDLIIKDETQRSWNLRINSCKIQVYIGEGCRKFIADNCLKMGDRIMFEVVTDGERPIWKFHVVTDAETLMRKFHGKPNTSIKSSIKASSHGKPAAHKPFGYSSFVCTIKPYYLTYGILNVPKHFVYANGLIANKKYDLIVKDETQRSWHLKINSCKIQVHIREGCRKFIADNCLKEGDHIMFEVVTGGETPIWNFHIVTDAKTPMRKFQGRRIKTSDVTALKLQVAASASADDNPHFISTIKSYALQTSAVYIPMPFARSTGLMNRRCEIILIDEKRRSWPMWLGYMGHHFGIKKGWTPFIKANGFRVGDAYKFELINNGKIPIAYISPM